MALVLKKLYQGYFWIFRDLSDPRTDDIFLVSTPLVPLTILMFYLLFCYKLGPKIMENRKPIDVMIYIRAYNVFQIITNAYVSINAARILSTMDWSCGAIDYSESFQGKLSLHLAYVFYLLKLSDLMDTVFFILRKSYRQITFLHVYHHFMMVVCLWVGCRYVAGGSGLWLLVVNSFVHAVMYTYYLLATIDDKWKDAKYKKILTQLQLVQFLFLQFTFGRLCFKADCAYPKWISIAMVPQNLLMFLMFLEFYFKSYTHNVKMKNK